ncbi:MAG: DEDD exonuclease domain-containing protein [Rubrobacteraceae bacterium]|nr:DEDD exonuclease domain-containing protein [Rubrobacteraceae bacterium]
MSSSLYGFLRSRGAVTPEEIAREFLAIPDANGEARGLVERLVAGDGRFTWDEQGMLEVVDLASLGLDEAEYVVFDLETTGSPAREGGITEIGAVRLRGGRIVEEFASLANPGHSIDPFVVRLTGITDEMVRGAPPAGEVASRFEGFAEGAVLVGHNVRFDCAFVEAAIGRTLSNPALDTLRLARLLVPGLRRYRLASLADHFGIEQRPNHRALADASATAGVFLRLLPLLDEMGVTTVGEAASLRRGRRRSKRYIIPRDLPHAPGVYYFVDRRGEVLYVGKAKDLRKRVGSYFGGGDGRRKVARLVEEAAGVRYRRTESELEALLLEAREIRRLLPRYNTAGRVERAGWYVRLDLSQRYPVPERVAAPGGGEEIVLGPYGSAGMVDCCIEALGRIFPLRRCPDEGDGPCFYGQMGRCGPCSGMDEEEYRREVVQEIAALLRGRGGEEKLDALRRERDRLAARLEFEGAARLRDFILGIERLRATRAAIGSEGVCAVLSAASESGCVEAFAFRSGRLAGYRTFCLGEEEKVRRFARGVLGGRRVETVRGPDELRIVVGYLRRRPSPLEVVRLEGEEDLVAAVRRVLAGVPGS